MRFKQKVRPKRNLSATNPHQPGCSQARRELSGLIKLPVSRKIGLGNNTQNTPAMNDCCTIIEQLPPTKRQPDHSNTHQVSRLPGEPFKGSSGTIQHHILKPQIIKRVASQPKLRKNNRSNTLSVTVLQNLKNPLRIGFWLGQRNGKRTGRNPGKTLMIK